MPKRSSTAMRGVKHANPDAALRKRTGPVTRFPGKVRVPFALCLPPGLHVTLQRTADRLGIKRGDVICELLVQYADRLTIKGGM